MKELRRRYPDGTLGQDWAGKADLFGVPQYSTYTEDSYDVIWDNYTYVGGADWFQKDFGKPNCSLANPRRMESVTDLTSWGFERVRSGLTVDWKVLPIAWCMFGTGG